MYGIDFFFSAAHKARYFVVLTRDAPTKSLKSTATSVLESV